MQFEIEVPLWNVEDVFETRELSAGISKDVPGDATIQLLPPAEVPAETHGLTFDSVPWATIAVTIGGGAMVPLALNLFSSWLYDRLKAGRRVRRIRINRRVVELTPDGIRRAIEESCEIEER